MAIVLPKKLRDSIKLAYDGWPHVLRRRKSSNEPPSLMSAECERCEQRKYERHGNLLKVVNNQS